MPMRVVYAARYHIDIGLHVFPTEKYRQVHDRLLASRGDDDAVPLAGVVQAFRPAVIRPSDIVEPQPATWDELALVHTREHLEKMREGALSSEDIAQLQLPWSVEMVEGFRLMVGGTIDAACLACGVSRSEGLHDADHRVDLRVSGVVQDFGPAQIVCHLGGGLHHAFANHGEGFCPFNDVAVAIRVLQTRGIERIAVVDLDVHHGNGTAFIFENDPGVFTFSMHQQHNYPIWKPRGSLDIGLPDGVHDATFLAELERALPIVMAARPQCVFYLAGADPYEDDQLGGLRLTKEGLRQRDRRVISAVARAGVPLVVVLAGGYARRVEDTVAIHVATVAEAKKASLS